ncbi:MAG: hypothetical protein HY763_13770 [Planctomycetes bacterium]|nr:hypothetical protein [Planctomycetota bacterium]
MKALYRYIDRVLHTRGGKLIRDGGMRDHVHLRAKLDAAGSLFLCGGRETRGRPSDGIACRY